MIEILEITLMITFSSFLIFITLLTIKQNWVNTFNYFLVILLLPVITFVITRVISNNLALSLGMIGALSIVRFRNPVKSPFELVLYFLLITLGISYGVNTKWGIFLSAFSIIVFIFSYVLRLITRKIKFFNFFKYSFSTNDGQIKTLIEIDSSEYLEELSSHRDLQYYSTDNNTHIYKIATSDDQTLLDIKKKLKNNPSIKNFQMRKSNLV